MVTALRLPTPLKISYLWSKGSMLGVIYSFQVVSGILLAGVYSTGDPFLSVDCVVRDIFGGWVMRYIHVSGASILFVFMLVHLGRGVYYQSAHSLMLTWTMGVIMFFLFMVCSFLGYVLPWGQMSFWGAAVITNFLSVIPLVGDLVTQWVWGGFGVGESTLMRFLSFHIVVPLLGVPAMLVHMGGLHSTGSSNPLGVGESWVSFGWLFMYKDMVGFLALGLMFVIGLTLFPNLTTDAANYLEADPLVTPTHMKPEWYFLAAYAVLRSVPDKMGGVMAMCVFIFMHSFVPLGRSPITGYSGVWLLLSMFLVLTWLGGCPAEEPFVSFCQYMTFVYFVVCLFMI